MQISCERCATVYVLDEKLLPEGGAAVECTKCNHVFTAKRPPAGEGAGSSAAEQPRSGPAEDPNRTMLEFPRRAPASAVPSGSSADATLQAFPAWVPPAHASPAESKAQGSAAGAQAPAHGDPNATLVQYPAAAPRPAPASTGHATMMFGRFPEADAVATPAPDAPQVFGVAGGPVQSSPGATMMFGRGAEPGSAVTPAPPRPLGSAPPSPGVTMMFGRLPEAVDGVTPAPPWASGGSLPAQPGPGATMMFGRLPEMEKAGGPALPVPSAEADAPVRPQANATMMFGRLPEVVPAQPSPGATMVFGEPFELANAETPSPSATLMYGKPFEAPPADPAVAAAVPTSNDEGTGGEVAGSPASASTTLMFGKAFLPSPAEIAAARTVPSPKPEGIEGRPSPSQPSSSTTLMFGKVPGGGIGEGASGPAREALHGASPTGDPPDAPADPGPQSVSDPGAPAPTGRSPVSRTPFAVDDFRSVGRPRGAGASPQVVVVRGDEPGAAKPARDQGQGAAVVPAALSPGTVGESKPPASGPEETSGAAEPARPAAAGPDVVAVPAWLSPHPSGKEPVAPLPPGVGSFAPAFESQMAGPVPLPVFKTDPELLAFEKKLGRSPGRMPLVAVALVAVLLAAGLGVQWLRGRAQPLEPTWLAAIETALDLTRRDDGESLQAALAQLEALELQAPGFAPAKADQVLPNLLLMRDLRDESGRLEARFAALDKDRDAIERKKETEDWTARANARSEEMAALRAQINPLIQRAAAHDTRAAEALRQARALVDASGQEDPAAIRAASLYYAFKGNESALRLAAGYRAAVDEANVLNDPGRALADLAAAAFHAQPPANREKREKGLAAAEEALRKDSRLVRAHLIAARLHLGAREFPQAREAAEAILALNPRHQAAAALKAEISQTEQLAGTP